ncbi:hypothetical protein MTR67_048830 [Solanum verrucosum]|uniref:Uncharacterized protein n=1 Tax=Solanum verrucosum TaxID=315347 RepID=A0AAF1A008_SOLVR|nr:hypothetical protein MTR67_048830 [Solanum verrucosum]
MRRLFHFSADLILSFRAQHTIAKGEVRPFDDSPSGIGNPQAFISSFFSAFSFLFATSGLESEFKPSTTPPTTGHGPIHEAWILAYFIVLESILGAHPRGHTQSVIGP